jgi:TusA-related sulfurtransferase
MKVLMERWDKYLLNEISSEKAMESLNSKKTQKAVYRFWKEHDEESGSTLDWAHQRFKSYLLKMIPTDIEDGQAGTSLLWLLRLARSNENAMEAIMEPRVPNYREGVRRNLELFFHYQNFMSQRDLMQVKDDFNLSQIVYAAQPEIRAYQNKQDYGFVQEGTEVFRDDDEWYVAAIHNKSAACELGKETKWCTAHPGGTYFEEYYEKDDPLFFVKSKKDQKFSNDIKVMPENYGNVARFGAGDRFQFHYGREEFLDEHNYEIEPAEEFVIHKVIMSTDIPNKYAKVGEYAKEIEAKDPNTSPDRLAELSKTDRGSLLQLIADNPSTSPETLQWIAEKHKIVLIRAIANNQSAAPETLMWIINEYYGTPEAEGIFTDIASNRNATEEVLGLILKKVPLPGQFLALEIVENPNVTPKMINQIWHAPALTPRLQSAILEHPKTPSHILLNAINDPALTSTNVKSMFANPNLPPDIISKIYKKFDHLADTAASHLWPWLYKKLAIHPNTPSSVLSDMLARFNRAEIDHTGTLDYFITKNPNYKPRDLDKKINESIRQKERMLTAAGINR